jgi:hypothetical protein
LEEEVRRASAHRDGWLTRLAADLTLDREMLIPRMSMRGPATANGIVDEHRDVVGSSRAYISRRSLSAFRAEFGS